MSSFELLIIFPFHVKDGCKFRVNWTGLDLDYEKTHLLTKWVLFGDVQVFFRARRIKRKKADLCGKL